MTSYGTLRNGVAIGHLREGGQFATEGHVAMRMRSGVSLEFETTEVFTVYADSMERSHCVRLWAAPDMIVVQPVTLPCGW